MVQAVVGKKPRYTLMHTDTHTHAYACTLDHTERFRYRFTFSIFFIQIVQLLLNIALILLFALKSSRISHFLS